jgi:ABC-type antimicrobial peptide transport system permease subunit
VTVARSRTLLVVAAVVGGGVGGTIGWLTGSVAAGLLGFGGGVNRSLETTLIVVGSIVGSGLGAVIGTSSARKALSDARREAGG